MGVLTENLLREKLKTSPCGAYFIYGEEGYLKKHWVDKIISAAVSEDFIDFNFHSYDGKEAEFSDIYDSVEAVPMMSDTNCVLVTDCPFDTYDEESFAALTEMIKDLPDSCALIYYMQTVEPKGEKWKKIIKLFADFGNVLNFEKKEKGDLVKLLEKGAVKRGVPFENGAASYLINCVGSDLNMLLNELEKLCAYAAGRSITRSDVDEVCIKSLEAKVFDIIKAIHSGGFSAAMDKLGVVIAQREEPIKILGAFITSYVDMYRAKAAVTSGKKAEEAATLYAYAGKTFRLTNAARDSKALSLQTIYECIEILAQADEKLKTTAVDGALLLEQTLAKLSLAEGKDR